MATQGKVLTLFEDKEKTTGIFPRTKVSAVSDENGKGLDALLDDKLSLTGGTVTGDINIIHNNNSIASMSVTTNDKGEIEIVDGNGSSVLVPLSAEGNTAINFDGYLNANKNTNIYGNSVKIWSNVAGLQGREYGVNKVLWDGVYFMQESQTATLSESITAQPNGIVLVFSRYSSGKEQDSDFNYFFVPKYQVIIHDGKGSGFMMVDSTGTAMARKYLYIYDNKITGHANNIATGSTSCGITWTNNGFVLRQVIGV